MKPITLEEILKSTCGKLISEKEKTIEYISTDSRDIKKNTLYIPIIGERLDGHNFLEDAYNNGCRIFLIDKNHEFSKDDISLIEVEDTTKALGLIAKGYKENYDIKTIGITGSVGKTTTKDMTASVISQKYNTLKTEGNFNNEIGLPKMLLKLDGTIEVAVLEMGMGQTGDIQHLVNIVNPNIAIISNIGTCHIEHFKDGQVGIFNAKLEITTYFNENNILIINGEDKFLKTLKDKKHNFKIYSYGFGKENDIYCKDYNLEEDKTTFTYVFKEKEETITLPVPAKHNILNALAAILLGNILNISDEKIKEGLENFKLTENRLDIIKGNKYTIINDCYNANLDSMKSALEVLSNYKNRKVAILGDIKELGPIEEETHIKLGEETINKTDILIAIGPNSINIKRGALKKGFNKENIYTFNTLENFLKEKDKILKEKDTILVKASHSMQFEKIVEVLENENKLSKSTR